MKKNYISYFLDVLYNVMLIVMMEKDRKNPIELQTDKVNNVVDNHSLEKIPT